MAISTFKKAAVGGTFDRLHSGHKTLLSRAFEVAEFVLVGITSDEMLSKEAESYNERKRALEKFLRKFGKRCEIVKLHDAYGPAATDAELDAIVVSEETKHRAIEINEMRKKKNLKPLEIIVIPLVLAEDGAAISSTRIRRGEVDEEGRVL